MKNIHVRLEKIIVKNFKNVKYGCLLFNNAQKKYASSVTGIYGQNGSGKTAIIDALMLLKVAASGESIPALLADYIHVDADFATIKYVFRIEDTKNSVIYPVAYELNLKKEVANSMEYIQLHNPSSQTRAIIFDEVLYYTGLCKTGRKKTMPLLDTGVDDAFCPKSRLELLTKGNKDIITNLIVAKKLAAATSKSYLFSKEFLDILNDIGKDELCNKFLRWLAQYATDELFVINTQDIGLISFNALPLAFKYQQQHTSAMGQIVLPLDGATTIPQQAYEVINKIVLDMNTVLSAIIPGLTIDVKALGTELLQNGTTAVRVQLVSNKNGKEIPLRYESEGIKKIISVLHLLIVVYNNPSITVAIDELDSGVFEYLLGELLRILSQKGSGQLIFTCHNFRPLETLDYRCIVFTTTNPQNRYIHLKNLKKNNNLRDVYYRKILLGEQKEEVYSLTNNSEIAFAFREAGECIGC